MRIAFEIESPVNTEINAITSGGSVYIENLMEISMLALGGSMEVVDIQGNIEMRTSGGSIRLENIDGQAEVATSGGTYELKKLLRDWKQEPAEGH